MDCQVNWSSGMDTRSENRCPTLCNFEYSGSLIEHNLLGSVAYRVGKKLQWDSKNLRPPTLLKPVSILGANNEKAGLSSFNYVSKND